MDHSPTDRRFGGLGRQGNYLPLEDLGSLPPSTPAPQETAEEFTSPASSALFIYTSEIKDVENLT
jgi:hypothetical protein